MFVHYKVNNSNYSYHSFHFRNQPFYHKLQDTVQLHCPSLCVATLGVACAD